MTLCLTNTSRRIATFALPHASYCEARGKCACTRRRGGARVPSSLTLAVGAPARGLDKAVMRVPAIALAARRSELRIEHESPVPSTLPQPEPQGGPEGAPTTPVEVLHEPRTVGVENRSVGDRSGS